MSLIKIEDLYKSYGENEVLKGLDIDIEEGEIYGFLGPNGAGKTTAIQIVLGLIRPDEGKITINDIDVLDGDVDVRKMIGYLPEKISMYDNLTVRENLKFLCELKGCPIDDLDGMLSDFDMVGWNDKKLSSLSKGMLQSVGFVQAMIGDPDILILDEPTSGLDPKVRKWVKDKILRLKEKGKTILLSSHILSEVQELCDRVGVIKDGEIIAEGEVETFFDDLKMVPKLVLQVEEPIEAFKLIEELDYVDRPRLVEGEIVLYCRDDRKMDVIKLLLDEGFEVNNFSVKRPDLEEVFVRLTEGG